MVDLSIIFPCYNEEKNLVLLIKKIIATKKKNYKTKIEFILVNNGSTDNTALLLRKLNHKICLKLLI
tara:strand:+ start:411 stop:611 length:201 start_codon:yes stop_codon:yes gene_type:complete